MFPLHPLTVEDVLQQESREKIDVFEKLGYYFVVMRAVYERYFRYTSGSSTNSAEAFDQAVAKSSMNQEMTGKDDIEMHELPTLPGLRKDEGDEKQPKRARVDIIEGLDGKEGLEGVSVGAMNLYLVVFEHGVISVSMAWSGLMGGADPSRSSFTLTTCRSTPIGYSSGLSSCLSPWT